MNSVRGVIRCAEFLRIACGVGVARRHYAWPFPPELNYPGSGFPGLAQ
ncbi:hypothetical protein [Streptomyces yangpuensis]